MSEQTTVMTGDTKEPISVGDRIKQLQEILNIREQVIKMVENEKSFDDFKMNTAELRGEYKALLSLRLDPPAAEQK